MIRYALTCTDGHSFESWFQSSAAFDDLAAKGLISCAICGSPQVSKAMMAPRVAITELAAPAPETPTTPEQRPLSAAPAHPAEQMLRALKEHLDKNSTYVGGRFAKEARAMHLGEAEEKPIHGEATPDEAKALLDDGVPVAPLPILPRNKTN